MFYMAPAVRRRRVNLTDVLTDTGGLNLFYPTWTPGDNRNKILKLYQIVQILNIHNNINEPVTK